MFSASESERRDSSSETSGTDPLAEFFSDLAGSLFAGYILIRFLIQVHQLVEQALNTSSGNGGGVIKLIIRIVVIVEDQ